MRITYLPKQRIVRRLLGLGDMYGEERARFLEVIFISIPPVYHRSQPEAISAHVHLLARVLIQHPHLPPRPNVERSPKVMAIDNASSMQSEMVAIVTATVCKLMLWDHRILFDMDFGQFGAI